MSTSSASVTRRGVMAAAALGLVAPAIIRKASAADTAIRWLHLETNPEILGIWNDAAAEYAKAHPGVQITLQFLENEAFKAKLPTLLQSPDAPSMFYSWGGGVMRAQADTGALRPIGAQMDAAWQQRINPAALDAFRYQGKIWGAPHQLAVVDLYYNKSMFQKAGVSAEQIKSWDDFLAAVQKLKSAGITPIAAGGGDKWPIMHYWSYLCVRTGGKQAFTNALAGKGDGFASAPFVEAGRLLKQLADLHPFQDGYLGATYPSQLGDFGDGRAAITLSFSGTYQRQAHAAADGKGLARDNVGMIRFPTVPGGKGQPTDTMGGMNAWLVSRNAPPQTVDFLNLLTDVKYQSATAATGVYLPAVLAANDAIKDPLLKVAADELAQSTYHQNYYDQDLVPDVGRVVNDQTTALVSGSATPEQVAKRVQDAWSLNH
jgi:raffinose/stachyose/melibiose transport system substrate-binding protein